MIYGERIKQARELSGLTQRELAEQVGVHQSTIAYIEIGRLLPSGETLESIAKNTQVLPSFFSQAPIEDFAMGSLAYRARKGLRAIERDEAYQFAKLCVEQARHMAAKLNLPPLVVPPPANDPIEAARLARLSLEVDSEKPIPNLINVLERKGFLLIALPFELQGFDAFCTWAVIDQERPIIAISSGKPGDRQRFSVAHELAHLVLHKGIPAGLTILEREADQFAAEFLLPGNPMRQIMSPNFNLTAAARLKLRWGVSMQALVRRAHDLRIITDRHYRYLFEQISRRGWKMREPTNLDIPVEKPRTFRKMVEMNYGLLYELEKLASAMHVTPIRADNLLSEYAVGMGRPALEGTEEYIYSQGNQGRN